MSTVFVSSVKCLILNSFKPFLLILRYNGEIGDVVIGRVIEVGQRRWRVDTHTRMNSFLMLSSVNLPGGELVSEVDWCLPVVVVLLYSKLPSTLSKQGSKNGMTYSTIFTANLGIKRQRQTSFF